VPVCNFLIAAFHASLNLNPCSQFMLLGCTSISIVSLINRPILYSHLGSCLSSNHLFCDFHHKFAYISLLPSAGYIPSQSHYHYKVGLRVQIRLLTAFRHRHSTSFIQNETPGSTPERKKWHPETFCNISQVATFFR
jgi:hypothetical protein